MVGCEKSQRSKSGQGNEMHCEAVRSIKLVNCVQQIRTSR